MSDPEVARIAVVESELRAVRGDIAEQSAELRRTRERLHKLESTTAALVSTNTEKIRQERRAADRLELRIQALTVAVLIAGVVVPLGLQVVAR